MVSYEDEVVGSVEGEKVLEFVVVVDKVGRRNGLGSDSTEG